MCGGHQQLKFQVKIFLVLDPLLVMIKCIREVVSWVCGVLSPITVEPRLSGYSGTRPWPDKRNSRNHHPNSVYNVLLLALLFLFLSCYPLLVQTIVVFRPLQASNGLNSGIFAPCGAWALKRMCRDRDRIIQAARYLRFR